jgi:hypothetical protein
VAQGLVVCCASDKQLLLLLLVVVVVCQGVEGLLGVGDPVVEPGQVVSAGLTSWKQL